MEPLFFLLLALGVLGFIALFTRLKSLEATLHALTDRVATLERRTRSPETSTIPEKVSPPPVMATPPPLPPTDLPRPFEDQRNVVPPPLPVSPPAAPSHFNWEAFMGVKLFGWLGGLALFLGIIFLVRYSFENNLITPFGRVVIGGAVAIILVALGGWLARGRYAVTAQTLCATGIVIFYGDLFAAHSFYGLVSLTTAFFAMTAVTLFSFLLAVALSTQVIVILGLLGGFLTPLLLASGSDNAPVLFLYVALLDLGVAAVALRKGWPYLILLAAAGTTLTQLGWAGHFFNATTGLRALWIFLGFEALFLALDFLPGKGGATSRWTEAAAALAGFTALAFAFWLSAIPGLARQPLFFFSFVFLADAGLLMLPVLGRAYRGIALGAGALTFLLVAEWIGLFANKAPPAAALAAIVVFALLHAATTPASAWRPALLPITAGGTITPFLLLILLIERVDLWDPTPVFAVALILAVILLAAAIVRRADWLALSALLGAGLTELSWQGTRFSSSQAAPALICYGFFLVLFVAYPFCSAEKEKAWSWAVSALGQALQFWLVYRVIARAFPNHSMGLLPAAFALPAIVGIMALRVGYRADPATGDARLAWQGGALLLFVSLIFPLQFDREWITLGWALEGLALLWLFHRVPHRGLRLVGCTLLVAAFARLALNPAVFEYHRRTSVHIFNWYLYAYGVTSLCLLLGRRIFGNPRPRRAERFAPVLLGSLGTILLFLLLNIEIADYFSIGPTLTFSFSGNFARDMTYSIAWGLFALGLIVIGMRVRQPAARYAGVALLGVTLAKLFFHDLNDLDELYRIGAFVSVAVILIAASFIYQRFLVPERAVK